MSEVRVEQWEVECEVLDTLPLSANSAAETYPQPKLKRTGRFAQVSLQTVELSNDLVKAVICPDLGGRVIELVDLRTGEPAMARPETIRLEDDSRLGATWSHGLWLDAGTQTLGPVDLQVRHDLGAVFLHHLVPGSPMSWTLSLSLRGDDPVLMIEARVYNRSLLPVERYPDLCCGNVGAEILTSGSDDFVLGGATGFRLYSPASTWTGCSVHAGHMKVQRRAPRVLLPRETDSWSVDLHVFSGRHRPTFSFPSAVVSTIGGVAVYPAETLAECTLYVQTPEGDTLEAEADLTPAAPFEAELGFTPKEVAAKIRGQRISAVPLARAVDTRVIATGSILDSVAQWPSQDSLESRFFNAVTNGEPFHGSVPGLQSACAIWRAILNLRQCDFSAAYGSIEKALLTNSEDHLAWWMKAVCERHMDQPDETTLLNAHFLAPLEPALIGESMLSAWAQDPEAPRVLPPALDNDSTALLEVLSLYLECGLYKDVSDILNATTNRSRPALVSYVNAWLHIVHAHLLAEAAHHVATGSSVQVEAPLPWRRVELQVVRELANRFPQDVRLKAWSALLDNVRPSPSLQS